jgi:hypothetical protein
MTIYDLISKYTFLIAVLIIAVYLGIKYQKELLYFINKTKADIKSDSERRKKQQDGMDNEKGSRTEETKPSTNAEVKTV